MYSCEVVFLSSEFTISAFSCPFAIDERIKPFNKKNRTRVLLYFSQRLSLLILLLFTYSFRGAKAQENDPALEAYISSLNEASSDTARIRWLRLLSDYAPDGVWESYNVELKTLCERLKSAEDKKTKKLALLGLSDALNNEGYYFDLGGMNEKALESYNRSLSIRRQLGDSCLVAQSLNNIGASLEENGEIKRAEKLYKTSLALRLTCGDQAAISESYNNLGLIAQKKGDYSEALACLQRSLRMREAIHDKKGICGTLINLGLIYDNMMNDHESAIVQYKKSLGVSREIKDEIIQGIALDNIGVSFKKLAKVKLLDKDILMNKLFLDSALFYFRSSLSLRDNLADKAGRAFSLNNLGEVNMLQNRLDHAEDYFRESLKIRQELDDKEDIAFSLANLGNLLYIKKDFAGARKLADEAHELSQKIGFPDLLMRTSLLKHQLYYSDKDYSGALDMYKTYILMRDSLQNQDNRKELIKKQYQFEYESKLKADRLLALEEKKVIEARFRQEKAQRLVLYGGISALLLFAVAMANRFRYIRKQKTIIELKEMETREQKRLVEVQNAEILSSIEYAKRIQGSILPSPSKLFQLLPEHFLTYLPKSIVAGDFYWLGSGHSGSTFRDIVFAVCDSTGHGVPGAMVSVVCSKALDKAYHEFKLSDPGALLSKTAEIVVEEFSKNAIEEEEIKDGMDASVLCFRYEKGTDRLSEILWAGANNSLLIIKQNGELKEIKPNKQPIGKSDIIESFTTHSISFEKGDMLYLYTDGYADQFGGEKAKKLTKNAFKNLLLETHHLPVYIQKEKLETFFRKYQGGLEQIDDVCLAGIRV